MKYYYFDKFVTLIKEIKEFHVSKIRLEDGQELYGNSKLLSIKQTYDNAISYIEMIINNMINSISDELKQCGYTWLNYHEYITNSFINSMVYVFLMALLKVSILELKLLKKFTVDIVINNDSTIELF